MKKIVFMMGCSTLLLTGCIWDKPETEVGQSRDDLINQTVVDEEGNEKPVLGSGSNSVQEKTANIRTAQNFENINASTLVIEEKITTVDEHVKDSTITIEKGAVLIVPYIKNSTITVQKGGELQVTERLKETKVILEGGEFSVRPSEIDDESEIVTE